MRRYTAKLVSGDVCVIKSDVDSYKIVKVLKVDSSMIHIALYKNRYSEAPNKVDTRILTFGRVDDGDGFGISHIPLSHGTFASWLPIRLQHAVVTDEDLQGYRMWLDAGGGSFG